MQSGADEACNQGKMAQYTSLTLCAMRVAISLMRVAISLMRGCNRATHLVCEGFEGLLLLRDPTAPTSTLRKHSRVVALDGDAALQMIDLHLERFTLGLHERASVGKLGT